MDVCTLKIEGRNRVGQWKYLQSVGVSVLSLSDAESDQKSSLEKKTSIIKPLPAIQSEICVVVSPSLLVVIGASYVFNLLLYQNKFQASDKVLLPERFKGTSSGVSGCCIGDAEVVCFSLLPRVVSPVLHVSCQKELRVSLIEPSLPKQYGEVSIRHYPPFPPQQTKSRDVIGIFLSNEGRWEVWDGQKVSYFQCPVDGNPRQRKGLQGDEEGSVSFPHTSKLLLDEDEVMPLLYVKRTKKKTLLKRLIDLLMSWEKRGAIQYRKRSKHAQFTDHEGAEEGNAFFVF